MDDKQKIKHWSRIFDCNEFNVAETRRIQEIDVALDEMSTSKSDSKIFIGKENSVFFLANLAETKSQFKKEKISLEKRLKPNQ